MVIFIAAILLVILLVFLFRRVPQRKAFAVFLCALAVLSCLLYHALTAGQRSQGLTPAQKNALLAQQQIYTAWDEKYQKDIDELDRNWAWYHQILEDFKEDNISIQTVYVRLTQLESDSYLASQDVAALAPPMELDGGTYDLVTSICQKTTAYADAQYRTIALTRAACDPLQNQQTTHDDEVRVLESVMNRESPSALFIADEMTQIHQNLSIPKEDEASEK